MSVSADQGSETWSETGAELTPWCENSVLAFLIFPCGGDEVWFSEKWIILFSRVRYVFNC